MEKRVKAARKILEQENIDALLVSSAINIAYLTGFFGLSTEEREGYALLTNKTLYVFASTLTAEGLRNQKGNFEVIELSAQHKLIPTIQAIIEKESIKNIGFEENLTYSEYRRFKKLRDIKLTLAEDIIEDIRIVKNLEEIKYIQKACEITDQTFKQVLPKIKEGITEKELSWEIEKYIKENGGELAFETIVAFSQNSAVPHHKTDNTKLSKNSIILLDFGAKIQGYCADMSRTIFFGKADQKFKDIYEAVRIAQELPFKMLKEGKLTPHMIDATSRDFVIEKGFPSIPHSVGHGIGLQVHELPHVSPGFKEEILPNTSFTIEPGIYISQFGGVRIEDTVYFDGGKIISLTSSPKELIEL